MYDNLANWPHQPDYLDHELSTGTLTVSEDQGEVIAFGGVLARQGLAHLGDLFVRPDHLGRGIGKTILAATLPAKGERVTFASRDPRALPLYVRFGMLPTAPLLYLTGDSNAAKRLPDSDVALAEADVAEIRRLDRKVSGRDRPEDLEFLQGPASARGFVAHRGNEAFGYGYCRLVEDAEHSSRRAFLGPIGAEREADAVHTTLAILRWAGEQASQIVIAVFGPHPATPIMVGSGFRVDGMDTFMASRVGLIDLARYCPSMELG